MRKPTLVKIIAAIVIVPVVLWGLFMYYAFAVIVGVLAVPRIYRSNVPLADSGSIVIEAVGETAYRSYGYNIKANYHPPAAHGGSEEIGSWHGDAYLPATYTLGRLIVFVPEPSQMFVRTASGNWKQFWMYALMDSSTKLMDEADQSAIEKGLGIDRQKEMVRGEVRYFSAEQNLLVIDIKSSGGILIGRLSFRLSDDGEKLQLLRAEKVEKHLPAPTDHTPPITH
jgi:hypothetical protein